MAGTPLAARCLTPSADKLGAHVSSLRRARLLFLAPFHNTETDRHEQEPPQPSYCCHACCCRAAWHPDRSLYHHQPESRGLRRDDVDQQARHHQLASRFRALAPVHHRQRLTRACWARQGCAGIPVGAQCWLRGRRAVRRRRAAHRRRPSAGLLQHRLRFGGLPGWRPVARAHHPLHDGRGATEIPSQPGWRWPRSAPMARSTPTPCNSRSSAST